MKKFFATTFFMKFISLKIVGVIYLLLEVGNLSGQTTVTTISPTNLCSKTFTYQVCQTSGNAISHWDLGIPACIGSSDIDKVYLDGVIFNNWSLGIDPSCANSFVLKWDNIQVNPGTCKEFKVVLKQSRIVTMGTWWSKYGPNCQLGNPVKVPSCNICQESVLPIDLKSFTATRNSSSVELKWETLAEQNCKGFALERNCTGSWEQLAFVPSRAAGGSSNSMLAYLFNDLNRTKGITQYRIRQIDFDNTSKYSEIRYVRGDAQKAKTIIYPNPSFDGKVVIVFEEAKGTWDVSLIEPTGRVVKQWKAITERNLQIENLPGGIYSLRIVNRETGEVSVERIVVNSR